MQEEWKIYKETDQYSHTKIVGHRVYEVSNLGRVKVNGEIVEPHAHGNYLYIAGFNIHRAVAELFVPNPENKPEIDHINTDRYDNRACNLRWVTHKENCNNPLTKQHTSESMKGMVYYEDRNRKISEALKGKPKSERHKQNMSKAQKGKPKSDEHKRKLSESHKGKPLSEEHKQKMSAALKGKHNPFYGKTHTEETKQKISIANKGKTPWNKGKKLSEETKQKLSEAHKEYHRKKRGN